MMSDDYAKYQEQCEKIRQENAQLLNEFTDWLAAKGTSETTVRRHRQNMDLYLNHFLLYEDAIKAAEGSAMAGLFLGSWFIRKAMWASQSSLKSSAASLKKFYTFMVATSRVTQENLDCLTMRIKEDMHEWLEILARYNDPNITDSAAIWGL